MVNLNNAYHVDDEPMSESFIFPADKYLCCITNSERKPTSTGNGDCVILEFTVMEGDLKGRKKRVTLNLFHKSEETVKFARAEFASIRRAVGINAPQDTVELHNVPLILDMTVEANKKTGKQQNRIRYYKREEKTAPQAQSDTPAWKRK